MIGKCPRCGQPYESKEHNYVEYRLEIVTDMGSMYTYEKVKGFCPTCHESLKNWFIYPDKKE